MIKSLTLMIIGMVFFSLTFISVNAYEIQKIDNKIKITFPERTSPLNVGQYANSLGIDLKNLVNVKIKKYFGDADIELMQYVDVPYGKYYSCNCIEDVKTYPNGTEYTVLSCESCKKTIYKKELRPLDLNNLVIDDKTEIYEVFKGCKKFSKLKDGWGCSAWTDVNIIDKIKGATWWNQSWGKCKNITIHSASSINNFPLLIRLDSSKIDYSYTKDDGADIRFLNVGCGIDGETLPYEIEVWNESGESTIWVKVNISDGKTISVYYDNPLAYDNQNPSEVWKDYKGVWHFATKNNSVNSNEMTTIGSPTLQVSKVGYGYYFDGNDAFVSEFFNFTNNMTAEVIVKLDNISYHRGVYGQENSWVNSFYFYFSKYSGEGWQFIGGTSSSWLFVTYGSEFYGDYQFFVNEYLADSHSKVYRDNELNDSDYFSGHVVVDKNEPFNFGRRPTSGGEQYFHGVIDEIRFTQKSITAEWRNATFQNYYYTDSFLSFGEEENAPEENVTINITTSCDICREAPIKKQYCDGQNIITVRYRQSCSGESCVNITQTDVYECQYGCDNSTLTTLAVKSHF